MSLSWHNVKAATLTSELEIDSLLAVAQGKGVVVVLGRGTAAYDHALVAAGQGPGLDTDRVYHLVKADQSRH